MTPAPDTTSADRDQRLPGARLPVTLTAGRRDDRDGDRGLYGIEDTRRARIGARSDGVRPCCITIHGEPMDYLPRMYGPAACTIVDQARKAAGASRRIT